MVAPTTKNRSLGFWLRKYYQYHDQILLCYRASHDSAWNDRAFYLGEGYNANKAYNHRSILPNEIVIEFDDKDRDKNLLYANMVVNRLQKDNVTFSLWHSGNKSYHVHCFVEMGQAKNPTLLKKVFMKYYSEGLPSPDLQLAVPNHMIRAENGLHERSGFSKKLERKSADYPRSSIIVQGVWERYGQEYRTVLTRRLSTEVNRLIDHPGFRYVLTAHQFRESGDGHERALFMLIHVLKPEYLDRKNELIEFLQSWYRYSGGTKFTDRDVQMKVLYHWDRQYTFTEQYLKELLESLGRADLMKTPPVGGTAAFKSESSPNKELGEDLCATNKRVG